MEMKSRPREHAREEGFKSISSDASSICHKTSIKLSLNCLSSLSASFRFWCGRSTDLCVRTFVVFLFVCLSLVWVRESRPSRGSGFHGGGEA